MDDPRINLLQDRFELRPEGAHSPWKLGRSFFLAVAGTALLGVGFSWVMTKTPMGESELAGSGFFRSIASFVSSGDRVLKGEEGDRINFLLLGIGGKGHDGPELSDTIIFGALQPSSGRVGLLSIPRDLAIPIPGYGWRKINHANYFGELEDPGRGAAYAANVVGDVLDQEMHYYVKMDFDGFEEFIDALGGVDVYVEHAFTDTLFPTSDHFTKVVRFEEGWQRMDGGTALVFARSRHGNNGEGSDFARSRRQQKILLAVKDKVFAASTFLNPKRVSDLVGTIHDNVETNLTTWEILRLSRWGGTLKAENVAHAVLDSGEDSPLYETDLNGAYVLLPDNDNWGGVQTLAANIFHDDPSTAPLAPGAAPASLVRLRIENGTSVNGLAFRTSQLLEGQGFEIVSLANASARDWDHTIIYDLSEGRYPEELKALQEYLEADIATTVTGWLFTDNVTPRTITLENEGVRDGSVSSIDFLVVLGQNSAGLVLNE